MKKAICSLCDCGKEQIIVNSHFFLCDKKNKERLNKNNETKKHKPKAKKINVDKIKQKEVYAELDQEREQVCSSCLGSSSITRSHIIPRSLRKDLAYDKRNIVFQCSSCHHIWEHGSEEEKNKLLNYENMMNYIKEAYPLYYNRLTAK